MNLNINNHKNEVDLYLMESLEKKSNTFDILMWWKVNSSKYPILSQIAWDFLVMPELLHSLLLAWKVECLIVIGALFLPKDS